MFRQFLLVVLGILLGFAVGYSAMWVWEVNHHTPSETVSVGTGDPAPVFPVPTKPKPAPTPAPVSSPTPTPSAAPKPTPSKPTSLGAKGDALWYAPGYPAKTVALTFDDGPGPSTPAIISILKADGIPATFFNIGKQIGIYPSTVQTEVADGFAMGDHTMYHADLLGLNYTQQYSEIAQASQVQYDYTNTRPIALRPPYGDYDAVTEQVCKALNLQIWNWSVDSLDWTFTGKVSTADVNAVVKNIETESAPLDNPVVLMHNNAVGNPTTVAALPVIIQWFQAHGYKFVAL